MALDISTSGTLLLVTLVVLLWGPVDSVKTFVVQMQLRVSDLLNDLHERTDLVEDRIEGIESKINHIQKAIESLPEQIGTWG